MTAPVLLHPNRERPRWHRALSAALPGTPIVGVDDDLSTVRYALAWKPPPGLLARMPSLEVFFALGAGVNHLVDQLPPGIALVRLEDAGMAEQMVSYHLYAVLHYFRRFDRFAAQQRAARWQVFPPPDPAAFRVRVLGHGVLGQAVGGALRDQGFDVAWWARTPRDGVRHGAGGLRETLSEADALIVLLPQTPETVGLLDAERLSWLPAGAAVINAARGALVDVDALLSALDAGALRGAFLDVAPVEPLPPGHALWRHPAVVLTPHIAAMTLPEPAVQQVADNIRRHRRGGGLSGLVPRGRGY